MTTKKMTVRLYERCSTVGQNLISQTNKLKAAYPNGLIYSEKLSGSSRVKPERDRLLDDLEDGDLVVATRLSRLSRSMDDMLKFFADVEAKGGNIEILHENIDTSTIHGRLVFRIMASVAQFQKELINETTSAGRKIAISKGVKFGRKPTIKPATRKLIAKLRREGDTLKEISDKVALGVSTVHRILNPDKQRKYNQDNKLRLQAKRDAAAN
jgi:DNA invertase Pin-like site-specific DNA recombinase